MDGARNRTVLCGREFSPKEVWWKGRVCKAEHGDVEACKEGLARTWNPNSVSLSRNGDDGKQVWKKGVAQLSTNIMRNTPFFNFCKIPKKKLPCPHFSSQIEMASSRFSGFSDRQVNDSEANAGRIQLVRVSNEASPDHTRQVKSMRRRVETLDCIKVSSS